MTVRLLKEEDFQDSLKLSMYAFQYNVPDAEIPKRLEKLKNHSIFGIWDQKQLAAKLHILPLHIYMGDEQWKMGGIAGVATYPEYRRNGFVRKLIIHSLEHMREQGQIVSFLHPFDIGFYRKYGWEIISDFKKVELEKEHLSILEHTQGLIKRFKKDSHPTEIEAIYQAFAHQYSGMLVRNLEWWFDHVYSDLTAAVYFNELGEAKGYILYKVKDEIMTIEEAIYLDKESRMGLWNFICQHDSMVGKVKMTVSIHDPFPYYLRNPKVKVSVEPYFMGRIVDVEAALLKFPFNKDNEGSVFLHLTDPFAHWNEGTYLLSGNTIQFFKQAKEGSQCAYPPKRGIQLDINSLTSILFGYKRPMELYQIGELKGTEEEIQSLEKMVPFQKSFFYDFF